MANELDDSPGAARKRVHERYKAYGEKVDTFSVQFCYALIGANWAVFQSTDGILSNTYATLSLVLVLVTLGAALLMNVLITEALAHRVDVAYKNSAEWDQAYEAAKSNGNDDIWPYTKFIIRGADWVRRGKTIFPLAAGVLLLVAILESHPSKCPAAPDHKSQSCSGH